MLYIISLMHVLFKSAQHFYENCLEARAQLIYLFYGWCQVLSFGKFNIYLKQCLKQANFHSQEMRHIIFVGNFAVNLTQCHESNLVWPIQRFPEIAPRICPRHWYDWNIGQNCFFHGSYIRVPPLRIKLSIMWSTIPYEEELSELKSMRTDYFYQMFVY